MFIFSLSSKINTLNFILHIKTNTQSLTVITVLGHLKNKPLLFRKFDLSNPSD